MLTVTITNPEILDKLRIQQDRLDAAVLDALDPALSMVRLRAPVGRDIMRRDREGNPVPHYGGSLRRGIIRVPLHRSGLEQSRKPGKAVGEIAMNRDMNDTFASYVRSGPNAGKRYYYPASQEFGFLHRSSGGRMSRVPGNHFFYGTSRLYEPDIYAVAVKLVEEIEHEQR